jgi:hypothetical protein
LEDSVFVGHERSIRAGRMVQDAMYELMLEETMPYAKQIAE